MMAGQAALGSPWLLRPIVDQGMSNEAKKLIELFDDALAFAHSMSLGERLRQAIEALREAYEEASSKGWDGYGSRAADPFSYIHALSLLNALPTTVPVPEVGVDPDGEIGFEWYHGPRWVVSVSVGRTGTLSYAGLFGKNKTHGVEQFVEGLPEAIAQNLRRLLAPKTRSHGSTTG